MGPFRSRFIGGVDLEVGRCRIVEDQVDIEPEQIRGRLRPPGHCRARAKCGSAVRFVMVTKPPCVATAGTKCPDLATFPLGPYSFCAPADKMPSAFGVCVSYADLSRLARTTHRWTMRAYCRVEPLERRRERLAVAVDVA